jgi:hypothetical protein
MVAQSIGGRNLMRISIVVRVGMIIALVALVPMSGCADRASSDNENERPSDPPDIEPRWPNYQGLELDSCKAAATRFDWPGGTGPHPPVPPGWEEPWDFADSVALIFLACDRINLNGTEVGPVSMVLELQAQFSPPDSCLQGEWQIADFLHAAFTDSLDAVQLLGGVGMNITYASVARHKTPNAVGYVEMWEVTPELFPTTTFSLPVQSLSGTGQSLVAERWFWYNETHLSKMDISIEKSSFQPPLAGGHGEVDLPFLYGAHSGEQTYAGASMSYVDYRASGEIVYYDNFQCLE